MRSERALAPFVACAISLLLLLSASACKRPKADARPVPRTKKAAQPIPHPIPFSGNNALAHAKALVSFGPRHASSPGAEEARKYCVAQLGACSWKVVSEPFGGTGGLPAFTNLVAHFQPLHGKRTPLTLLVGAHYDTPPPGDTPLPSANDSASGPAAILELARVLASRPELASQVELVLFDGHQPLAQFGASDGLFGSRFHASTIEGAGQSATFRAALLLGLVGGEDLQFTVPPGTPETLVARLSEIADKPPLIPADRPIWDDHLPFQHNGIPALLLTDARYPFTRTADDSPERLRAESLERCGRVLLQLLDNPGNRTAP